MALKTVEAGTIELCQPYPLTWKWLDQEEKLQTCKLGIEEVNEENFMISLSKITAPSGLDLSSKKGVKFLPVNLVSVMPNLVAIETHSCAVKSIEVNHFKSLSKLKFLNLANNEIEYVSSNAFVDLTCLESLYLSSNRIKSFDEKTFKCLKALKYLDLKDNEIQYLRPKIFESLAVVREIRLEGNIIDYVDENIFGNLSMLTAINLTNNNLNRILRNLFSKNLRLEKIWLANNLIGIIEQNAFDKLLKLKTVDLSENFCVNRKYGKRFNLMREDLKRKCSEKLAQEILLINVEDLKTKLNDKTQLIQDLERTIGEIKKDVLQQMIERYKVLSGDFNSKVTDLERRLNEKAATTVEYLKQEISKAIREVLQTIKKSTENLSEKLKAEIQEKIEAKAKNRFEAFTANFQTSSQFIWINKTLQNITLAQIKSEANFAYRLNNIKSKNESEINEILLQNLLRTVKNMNESLEDISGAVNKTSQNFSQTEFISTGNVSSFIFMFCIVDFLIALVMFVVYKYPPPRISCRHSEKNTSARSQI